jgi:NAD(P)-dependent dehydrogenase (short-subunit alcohol dehydrogenase family)
MRPRSPAGTTALLAGAGLSLLAGAALRRSQRLDLRGQVVVITGGSRGLGFLLAREFATAGCRVAICGRDEVELDRARQELERHGAEVLAVPSDIADRSQAEGLIQQTTARFGRVDVLVNNAGVIQVGPIQTMRVEDFEQALGVMFWGVVYPTMAVLPQMLARRSGRIVNITSIGGKLSAPHLLPYNAAKFAAVGLSEGLRAELAPAGVGVVTIVPGLMRTGSHLNAWFKWNRRREFTWFALGASLPVISMDAERAARRILDATRRNQAELILSPPAQLGARAHGMAPGMLVRVLSLVDRLLPSTNTTDPGASRGMELLQQRRSPLLEGLTSMGTSAARRFHQFPGPTTTPEERNAQR